MHRVARCQSYHERGRQLRGGTFRRAQCGREFASLCGEYFRVTLPRWFVTGTVLPAPSQRQDRALFGWLASSGPCPCIAPGHEYIGSRPVWLLRGLC
jgi:hypothetical protein